MACLLASICLGITPSLAQIAIGHPDYEPFADATVSGGTSYTPGANLAGQSQTQNPPTGDGVQAWWMYGPDATVGSAGGRGSPQPMISATDLTYPSLFTPGGGGSARFGGNRDSALMNLSVGSGGLAPAGGSVNGVNTVYFSYLLRLTDLSVLNTGGVALTALTQVQSHGHSFTSVPSAVAGVVMVRSDGAGGFNVGMDGGGKGSTAATIAWAPTHYRGGTTLFIVGAYNFADAAHGFAHGDGELWINPAAATFGNTSEPGPNLVSGGNNTALARVASIILEDNSSAEPTGLLDDLRVGLTWADVTGGPAVNGLTMEQQPANQVQQAGGTASFSISIAGGSSPVNYQWRKDGLDLSEGGNFSGVTSATLSLSNVDRTFRGGYSVKVTDASGCLTSRVARLTVDDPFITNQPVVQVLRAGTNALFQVGAAGAGPLIYQWYKDGIVLNNDGRISGASSATLSIGNLSSQDAGSYFVRITNRFGDTLASSNADLYVIAPSLNGSRPNILFILCDDLGYGDLGVLYQNSRGAGLPRELTPRMDSLAAQGLQLREHYCPAPVCAPSRASLLSGVHQGHANVHDQQWDKALADNHTLASVLRKAGYATAAIGKWGLGGDDVGGTTPADWAAFPTKRGFDYFFGYERHGDGHDHYPKEAIYSRRSKQCYDGTNNITSELDKCYTTDLFTARAKKWMVDQRTAHPGQPFFLYLAYDTPHAVYELPTQAYPAGGGTNGGMQWLGTAGHMINTASGMVDSYLPPDYASATYDDDTNPATPEVAWPEVFKRYAASVRRIDEAVGDLLALLQQLGMDSNTVVVFTSDNGPTTEDYLSLRPRYQANFFDTFGPMDGVKRDTFEGGIRMPTFVRWLGTIAAGAISNTPSEFQDWMPTFTDLAGLPAPARSDGVSLVPTLTGFGPQRPSTIYIEYNDPYPMPKYPEFQPDRRGRPRKQMQVLRLHGFQGVRYDITSQTNDFEIYEVTQDPKETNNLALNPAFAGLQRQLKERVLQLRRPDASAPRPYDNELVPPVFVSPVTDGVEWKAYAERFPWVPELTILAPSSSGTTAMPTVAVRSRNDDIGLLFTGYILAPTNGNYSFYLSADTGALLRIHDATVIDADYGYVGGTEVSGTIKLASGLHPFRLYYARATTGTPALSFAWSGPGIPKQPIPASALRRDGVGVPTPSTPHDAGVRRRSGE